MREKPKWVNTLCNFRVRTHISWASGYPFIETRYSHSRPSTWINHNSKAKRALWERWYFSSVALNNRDWHADEENQPTNHLRILHSRFLKTEGQVSNLLCPQNLLIWDWHWIHKGNFRQVWDFEQQVQGRIADEKAICDWTKFNSQNSKRHQRYFYSKRAICKYRRAASTYDSLVVHNQSSFCRPSQASYWGDRSFSAQAMRVCG